MSRVSWSGRIISVQPRIGLTRSFDERYHSYHGYSLFLEGVVDGEERQFSVGVGEGTYEKHQFQVGDQVSGQAIPVVDERSQPVEFYRASKLQVVKRAEKEGAQPPPWHGVAPSLAVYRGRGHRRLSARTYASRCASCMWGCRMPVTIIVDKWKPEVQRYRFETFCYGPKSCRFYKAGPRLLVPGRRGVTWEEDDWIDEYETDHRGPDE